MQLQPEKPKGQSAKEEVKKETTPITKLVAVIAAIALLLGLWWVLRETYWAYNKG